MENRMKVVQINVLGATLSTGRTTREMHNYFLNHNIDSFIVCPAPLDCEDAFFYSTRKEMKLDTLMTMVRGLEGHNSIIPTKRLLKYLDEIKPDIVHLRILHSNCVNLPLLFKYLKEKNIATVITLHDFWFLTGKCCFYTNLNCDRWQSGCYNCPMHRSKSRPVLLERSKRMWHDKVEGLSNIPRLALVGVSDWVANEARKSPIAQKCIVQRIYNWIDTDTFHVYDTEGLRKDLDLKNKFVVLGVSASWMKHDRKGLDTYLELSKDIPENYVIVLVGKRDFDGELPDNIKMVGAIKDKQILAQYYSLADVYLNLSTEETFGKVSAESLACGTPIVAIDATVNKELVSQDCGIVVPKGDIEALKDALKIIEQNTKDKYSTRCVSFAKEKFSLSTNIEEYISLYKSLIRNKL